MSSNKGRTLWEILTGRNKRDLTPLELQYHNPLKAKCGCTVTIDHDADTTGVHFTIERMAVYETIIGSKSYYHTDYLLKGVTLDRDRPLRLRLRLIPDDDTSNKLGSKVLLLNLYDEHDFDSTPEEVAAGWFGDKQYGEFMVENVLAHPEGIFEVNQDDNGVDLAEPWRYWRVEDVLDPYHAKVATLRDVDGDGKVDESEVSRAEATYWDYWRETVDAQGMKFIEYLTVEMDEKTRCFTFFRGREIGGFQVTVY